MDPEPDQPSPSSSGSPAAPGGGRLPRRTAQLLVGLALYGVSAGLLVRAGLGLEPWGVLHQGISERTGLTMGVVTIIASVVVLVLWIPLRQRPGPGTLANTVLVGLFMDLAIAWTPPVESLAGRSALMVGAVLLNGTATGMYIATRFGPGPRDGLMTGLHRRTGRSVRLMRTLIEAVVLLSGLLLGGTVGVGTVLYALAVGPLAQLSLRIFAVPAGKGSLVVARGRRRGREILRW
ncbi:hypothetical protein [Streptomyces sp. NPDC005438]|uniref:membrane protein YczE n=1 Tax=Streptomyces sp. NPDC005438 TaxID=3156880 RepID=UPI0033A5741C